METSQTKELLQTVVERLRGEDVEKIFLFGSFAYGTPNEESDIDLYVVTRHMSLPENYDEHQKVYLGISRKIRDLKERFPIDLIVHTRPMHEKFKAMNSAFARKIMGEGILLYES
jgi:predicted nucleotidyltransferase